jgi:hypothetical protein
MLTAAGVNEQPEQGEKERVLRALLRRCRHALAVGGPEWERDVETAMALDAALVADIDAALAPA